MKEGSNGMGMHKHGVSGKAPKSAFAKLMAAKESNKSIEEKNRAKQKHKGQMFSSFKQLFNN